MCIRDRYYIAPCYNALIERGARVAYELIGPEQIVFCGTPQEYEAAVARPWE